MRTLVHARSTSLRRRRSGGLVPSVALAVIAIMVFSVPASAVTVTNTWQAKIGSAGANGAAKIQAFGSGTGSIVLKLTGMKASTLMPVVISKGNCSVVGTTVATLASIKTSSTGTAARTSALTAAQVTAISKATRGTGRIAIRVGSGTARKCGQFAVPTPVVGATIGVGLYPQDVTVDANGVWVTNAVSSSVSRIDPKTNAVLSIANSDLPGTTLPWAVAAGFGSLWVSMVAYDDTGETPVAGSVVRLDPLTGSVIGTIPVGRSPFEIGVSPEGVWVSNYSDGTVSRIDPALNQVAATITVGGGPFGVAAGYGSIWVADEVGGSVSRIDPATNIVTTTIPTVGAPEGIAAGLGSIWVANAGHDGVSDGTVSRIDPATNAVTAVVSVGLSAISVSVVTGSVWVSGFADADSSVVRVNPATNTVSNRVSVGVKSWGLIATDHAVWVVHPTAAGNDPTDFTLPGSVSRINY